jgi:hypothetical protein
MPLASEEQVPKPLTYTLMYHFLWFVMFLLSGLTLTALFLPRYGALRAFAAPGGLYALALLAAVGAFATYAVRLQVLLGEFTRADAFRWSAASSWAVIGVAPVLWAVWVAGETQAQHWWNGGQSWAPPEGIASAVFKVEIVVWWLSHLLSIRGLARGRRRYLAQPGAGEAAVDVGADVGAAAPTQSTGPGAPAALAAAGEGRR